MENRRELEVELSRTLELLKKKVDDTMDYIERHPEDTDYAAELWSSSIRNFMNYGTKKSDSNGGQNLFKKVGRMILFGK